MSEEGFSRSKLMLELEEMRRDRTAFVSAYDIIRRRILESNEVQPPRFPLLHEWSGTRAVCGSFELSIHAIERTIVELEDLIRRIDIGELPDADPPRPTLSLVKEIDIP